MAGTLCQHCASNPATTVFLHMRWGDVPVCEDCFIAADHEDDFPANRPPPHDYRDEFLDDLETIITDWDGVDESDDDEASTPGSA